MQAAPTKRPTPQFTPPTFKETLDAFVANKTLLLDTDQGSRTYRVKYLYRIENKIQAWIETELDSNDQQDYSVITFVD